MPAPDQQTLQAQAERFAAHEQQMRVAYVATVDDRDASNEVLSDITAKLIADRVTQIHLRREIEALRKKVEGLSKPAEPEPAKPETPLEVAKAETQAEARERKTVEAMLKESQVKVRNLTENCGVKDRQIADLNRQLAEKDAEIERLHEELTNPDNNDSTEV